VNTSKGRDTCKSENRQLYIKKKGGSVDDCSLHTRSSDEQGLKANKDSSAEALKIGTLSKISATEASVWNTDAISQTLGSTQARPPRGRGRSKEPDRSDALPASPPFTSSTTGATTWIAPTEIASSGEEMEEEDEDEDEQEGDSGIGD